MAALTASLVLISAGQAGFLAPIAERDTARGVADTSFPDIYLVLLDGGLGHACR